MLEINAYFPSKGMNTMPKWHKPLGNPVTFDLIGILCGEFELTQT